jgi:hypothetical protein
LKAEPECHNKSVIDRIITIYAFVRWAFHTFPNLLFIALGDFSYGRRSTVDQNILRRYPFPGVDLDDDSLNLDLVESPNQDELLDGFRELNTDDFRFLSCLEQFRDVLEACPSQPLYRKNF